MRSRLAVAASLAFPLFAAACGGGQAASTPTQAPPAVYPGEGAGSTAAAGTASASSAGASDAHALVVAAAACWMGGTWGDALGEPPDRRKAADEARCNDVVRRTYGAEDKTRYEQLRALDVRAVEDVRAKVASSAEDAKLLTAVADAQREAMDARRAGDKVKKDLAGQREPEKLSSDEVGAVAALKNGKALGALLKLDAGGYAHDAHALGVLTAMQRLDDSRGLPKHLKVYAMEAPLGALFGTPAPNAPEDATKRLDRGAYLAYLTEAAKSAGHPVPDTAKTPRDREPLAWAGVVQGVADKLKMDAGQVVKGTPLDDVVTRAIERLEAQVKAEQNAAATTAGAPATAKPASGANAAGASGAAATPASGAASTPATGAAATGNPKPKGAPAPPPKK